MYNTEQVVEDMSIIGVCRNTDDTRIYNDNNNSCSLCGRSLTIFDPENGEIVCSNCGMVIREGMETVESEYKGRGLYSSNQRGQDLLTSEQVYLFLLRFVTWVSLLLSPIQM